MYVSTLQFLVFVIVLVLLELLSDRTNILVVVWALIWSLWIYFYSNPGLLSSWFGFGRSAKVVSSGGGCVAAVPQPRGPIVSSTTRTVPVQRLEAVQRLEPVRRLERVQEITVAQPIPDVVPVANAVTNVAPVYESMVLSAPVAETAVPRNRNVAAAAITNAVNNAVANAGNRAIF